MTGKARNDGAGSYFHTTQGWVAQVRYYDPFTGKSRQVRRRARNRDHAREVLKELREDVQAKAPAAKVTRQTRVADYCDMWVRDVLPTHGVKPSTADIYTTLVRTPLRPTLGEVSLADFDTATARRWLARLDLERSRGRTPRATRANPDPRPEPGRLLSASTKRQAFAVLKLALDQAVRDRLIAANPLAEISRPSKVHAEVPVLTADQVDILLVASTGRWIHPLLVFVADTGVRLGEALALRWSDVDLDAGTAVILRSTPGATSPKTSAGRRAVPLVPDVLDALKEQRSRQRQDRLKMGPGWTDLDLVFASGTGTALDPHNARRALRRVLSDAGLPTERPWHTLRHSLATRLLNRGVPMPVVSALIGHASIRTTVDIYGHSDPALTAAAMAQVLAR